MDYDDRLTWGLSTKVDKLTHDEVLEQANHRTKGNASEMVRQLITIGLERLRDPDEDAPELGLVKWLQQQEKKKDILIYLQRVYLGLLSDPDPKGEAAAAQTATKYGLPWPPEKFKVSDVDPHLRKIRDRIQTLQLDKDNTKGTVSLRDLNRSLGSYSADDLRTHLVRLADLGEIDLIGSLEQGKTLEVSLKPSSNEETIH